MPSSLDTENSARTISATHTPSFPPSHPPTSVSTRTFHPCRRTRSAVISARPTRRPFARIPDSTALVCADNCPPTRTTHRAFYRGTPPVSSPARAPRSVSSASKNSSVAADTTPETNRTTIPTIPTIPTPSSTPPTRPTAPHASSDASPIAFDDASSTSSSSSPSSSETYPKRRSSFGTPSRASSSSIDVSRRTIAPRRARVPFASSRTCRRRRGRRRAPMCDDREKFIRVIHSFGSLVTARRPRATTAD